MAIYKIFTDCESDSTQLDVELDDLKVRLNISSHTHEITSSISIEPEEAEELIKDLKKLILQARKNIE